MKMGYSCRSEANDTLAILGILLCGGENRNRWEEKGKKHFYEIGKEQADGAITGSIWVHSRTDEAGNEYYQRSSTFRINPDGRLARGPKSWKTALSAREKELKTEAERNSYVSRDWRWYTGSELLTKLRKEVAA